MIKGHGAAAYAFIAAAAFAVSMLATARISKMMDNFFIMSLLCFKL